MSVVRGCTGNPRSRIWEEVKHKTRLLLSMNEAITIGGSARKMMKLQFDTSLSAFVDKNSRPWHRKSRQPLKIELLDWCKSFHVSKMQLLSWRMKNAIHLPSQVPPHTKQVKWLKECELNKWFCCFDVEKIVFNKWQQQFTAAIMWQVYCAASSFLVYLSIVEE